MGKINKRTRDELLHLKARRTTRKQEIIEEFLKKKGIRSLADVTKFMNNTTIEDHIEFNKHLLNSKK